MTDPGPVCANCGTALAGAWCHGCGQKRFRPEDRTLRHLATEFLEAVANVDGRLIASLRDFLLRPGAMAAGYLAGARRRYLPPVTLFLLANLVYFLAPPLSDFALSLTDHVRLQPYSGMADALVRERLSARGVSFDGYAAVFEARQDDLARTLVILHVPFIALGLAALHFRRRRPAADHAIVATWIMTYVLAIVMTVPFLVGSAAVWAGLGPAAVQSAWRLGMLVVAGGYLTVLLKGAYAQPGWLALAKLPLVFAVILAAGLVYRGLMFAIVFAST